MTLQEIFDKAAKHLLTQNIKAIVPSEKPNMTGSCKYLDPKTGYTCAVGCFFDKRTYTLKFEGEPVSLLFREFPYTMDKVFTFANEKDKADKLALLSDLQMVHDGVDVPDWAQKLSHITKRHNLTMIEV